MKPAWRRIRRTVFLVLLLAFIAIQFVRPGLRNPAISAGLTLESRQNPPPEVSRLLAAACNDCHSHETKWPCYSQVAPVSWLVANDVREGRRHLNFSRIGEKSPRDQAKLLREAAEEVSDGGMPIAMYRLTHAAARLSGPDRTSLATWFASAAASLDDGRQRGRQR